MDLHPEPPCLAVCKRPGSRPEKSWTGMDAHGLNIMESDCRFVLTTNCKVLTNSLLHTDMENQNWLLSN